MEADETARRIRQINDIEIAMDKSGEGKSPLTDALRNAIPFMIPEEIRETLFRTLDKLDELYGDHNYYEQQLLKEREAHDLEVSRLKAEMASKERSLAEKDSVIAESKLRIACFEKELAKSKGANVDANHKVESGAPPGQMLKQRNSAETTEVLTRFEARLEKIKLNIDRRLKKGQTAINYAVNWHIFTESR